MTRYQLKNIRQLITAVYSLEELRQLAFEEFREVYEDYNEARKSVLVRELLAYAERKGQLDRLLALTEAAAPAKYAEFAGKLILEPAEVDLPPEPAAGLPPFRPFDPLPAEIERFTLAWPFELPLHRVAAGEFLMGSNLAQDDTARDNEQPQHRVYLSDFYIGKYPVSNGQFATFIEATNYQAGEPWRGRGRWFLAGVTFPSGDKDHPATYISWHDAVAFCRWLSQESGYTFRLPSEAEWEKAARGGQGRIYPWGNDWDYKRLNTLYSNLSGTTVPGRFSPQGDSPYGLADMAGNVWEWCADWFEETIYRQRTEPVVKDPLGPLQGARRVLRGGSWSGDRYVARAAFRYRYDPNGRRNDYGFRVVLQGQP
jgi:formylglycine-generating enzyme required for sulfatase activity